MNVTTNRALAAVLAGAIAIAGALIPAQPAAAQYAVAGAPGVANVSIVMGDVVIVRGDSGEQVAATINAPLLPGDYISTAGGSRAEVQFDGTSMLRLAQDTQVRFVDLRAGSREMQLAGGTAELAELQGIDGGAQVDTPSVTVRPNQAGDYRVSVMPNGDTLVTVRSGSATVSSGSGTQTVTAGSTLVAYGPYSNPRMTLEGAIAYDAFDRFNDDRNAAIVAAYNSDPYLSPQLAGYTNFAGYGQWSNVPGYGEAWSPYNQSNNWTPYSNGQWVWEPGYGYTWVGNEPWGYAPYHYGRWFNYNNQWMWQPPAYQYQTNGADLVASWLPALVGFFLSGGSGTIGYPGYNGNIGWVPLAPGEPYSPWYPGFGANPGYAQYGVTHVTYVYNIYRNYRYVRVFRMYPFDRFRNGEWHRPILMHPGQLKSVTIVRGAVPIVPTKVLMRSGPIAVAHPVKLSQQFHERRFTARPPVMQPMTFAKSQAQLESLTGKAPKAVPYSPAPVAKPVPYAPPATHKTYHAPATAKPRPIETMRPRPVETMRPRPVETMAPRPIATMRPHPIETMRPHPVETMAPRPVATMRPHPVETMRPRPIETMAPLHPQHTMSPVFRATPAHPPAAQHQPAPKAHATSAPSPGEKHSKTKETPPPN